MKRRSVRTKGLENVIISGTTCRMTSSLSVASVELLMSGIVIGGRADVDILATV